jgi:hypothetical protein
MTKDFSAARAWHELTDVSPPIAFGPRNSSSAERAASPFNSFFLAGFECSTHRRSDGRRLDLLASTGHDRFFAEDYRALMRHGIATVRDGLRWHLIEIAPGAYDWSSALPMLRAARGHGMQVVWDLCHYGWPDGLDIWSGSFVERFARFSAAAARIVCEESDAAPFFCTVNEISYWAWAGGEVGRFGPGTHGRGDELKRQLARASIAATAAIRAVNPRTRFLHAEPAIHVAPRSSSRDDLLAAETYHDAQFHALDMIAGRRCPELGGHPDCLDIVGINYYPDNQWVHGGGAIPLGHHAYRPLRELLAEFHTRYGRPLILSETGAEGTARASWLHYVSSEVRAAREAGVRVEGICLYPILDYPGWDNDRPCAVGLMSVPDGRGHRRTDPDLAAELSNQRARAPIGLSTEP